MLQVAKTPLGRRLWRIAKLLHLPLSEVGKLTPEALDFCDWSMLADDPKRLEQYENTYVDPDYEAFEKAFDEEMRLKQETETLMQETADDGAAQPIIPAPALAAMDDEWERID